LRKICIIKKLSRKLLHKRRGNGDYAADSMYSVAGFSPASFTVVDDDNESLYG